MINFETIRWKNFLSTGNMFTEIPLNKSQNALIIGENGAGKSTILDALCFVLFGKAFRRINKPQLVNSQNEKECVVELEFNIANKNYKIVRGIKPNIFEIYCNGSMINQDSAARDYQEYLEKQILRMNYKSFTQIVILGAASFTPFMQLTPADRRTVIEDLLDIQIFSTMNVIAKQKMQANKEAFEKNKLEISLKEEKQSVIIRTLKGLKENTEAKIREYLEQRQKCKEDLEELKKQIEKIKEAEAKLKEKTNELPGLRDKHKKLVSMQSKIEQNLSKHLKEVSFYEHNDSCPTCRQLIDGEFKSSAMADSQDKIGKFDSGLKEIKVELDRILDSISFLEETTKELVKLSNDRSKYSAQSMTLENYIQTIGQNIDKLQNADKLTIQNETELENVKSELTKLEKTKAELLEDRRYIETAINLLKDGGIKTKIIKQYIPIINKYVNKYLTQMGFFVNFTINENFEEVIKSRFRDEFSYQNFSEGEKMRIDLALLFTWRQVAKMKNSVNTNLLILDEVMDGSLDANGTEEFLKIMWDMIGDTNTFVISHKVDALLDKFQKVYRFEKQKNFSRLAISANSV